MSDKYEKVKVEIFATPKKYKTYDQQDEKKIVDIVHKKVLPREKRDYHSVKVKVKRKADGKPKAIVAYMLRKDTYTSDAVKVEVNENYEVEKFEDDYTATEEDEDKEESEDKGTFEIVDFVAATPVPEIPTAKAAVEAIYQWALNAGLKAKLLLGADASVANYKNYLNSGLRGFVNVGHGNVDHIVLSDGILDANWFNSIGGKTVYPAVVYFNSCLVFNNPLQPAIMKSGARTFIGGIVPLLIGKSEEVCKCFWSKILTQTVSMSKTLKDCETQLYPSIGAHGISGDMNYFNLITSPIENYMVSLYGEDGANRGIVAFIYGYKSGNLVLCCQFYREGSTITATNFARWGYVTFVYPWSRFSAIIDIFRNEKPINLLLNIGTKYGYISTSLEPIGETEA